MIRYYITTPSGRSRLDHKDLKSDEEAIEAFNNHWTANPSVTWASKNPKRTLTKEITITLAEDELEGRKT